MKPRSRGSVRLCSARPDSCLWIEPGFLSDPDGHDLEVLLDGVKLARRMASLPPLRALAGPELLPDIPADAAGDFEYWLRDAVRGSWHPTGTCAMGDAGDPLAVVDPSGRVHNVEQRRRLVYADLVRERPAAEEPQHAVVRQHVAQLPARRQPHIADDAQP